MLALIYAITFIALVIASVSDIKTREVPDYLNYSLLLFALASRTIYSLITSSYNFLLYGIYGFILALLFASLLYYLGQWGAGDLKTLSALGLLFGFDLKINSFLISFITNLLVVGALFGLFYSFFLALKNKKKFVKKFKKLYKKNRKTTKPLFFISLLFIILSFFIKSSLIKFLILIFIPLLFLFYFLFLFLKALETSVMIKYVSPKELTEGDWIVKDIFIRKKKIVGPKDLGINKKQIRQLILYFNKGKIKKIPIKIGMPFIPSFFISFIITFFYNNILFYFLS